MPLYFLEEVGDIVFAINCFKGTKDRNVTKKQKKVEMQIYVRYNYIRLIDGHKKQKTLFFTEFV